MNDWFGSHKRQAAPNKFIINLPIIITGDSMAAGVMWYGNIWYEYLNQDILNCGIEKDKMQIFLWRSYNIPLPQFLKFGIINYDGNNLDTDFPEQISDGLICVAFTA